MAEVTLKWELESKNFDELKGELGSEAVNALNIGNNHCKICVLASGPMCIKRSVCRIPQNEIWINKNISEL